MFPAEKANGGEVYDLDELFSDAYEELRRLA
jgi:hypothetical protein